VALEYERAGARAVFVMVHSKLGDVCFNAEGSRIDSRSPSGLTFACTSLFGLFLKVFALRCAITMYVQMLDVYGIWYVYKWRTVGGGQYGLDDV